MKSQKIDFTSWLIFFALSFMWGSSFILMKKGLLVFSSNEVGALRIFLAFVAVIPFGFKYFRKEHIKNWKAFLASGIFGNFLPAFLYAKAQTHISSSLAGMLNSLTPIFALLIAIIFFKTKPGVRPVIGILIGFIGAIGLLSSKGAISLADTNFLYGLLIVAATLSYGLNINIVRNYLSDVNPLVTTTWSLTFIGPIAGLYLFSTDVFQKTNYEYFNLGFSCVAVLGVFGTTISTIIYNALIRRAGLLFSVSVTYAIPIVAILWGIGSSENMYISHFVSITIIVFALWLINKR